MNSGVPKVYDSDIETWSYYIERHEIFLKEIEEEAKKSKKEQKNSNKR